MSDFVKTDFGFEIVSINDGLKKSKELRAVKIFHIRLI